MKKRLLFALLLASLVQLATAQKSGSAPPSSTTPTEAPVVPPTAQQQQARAAAEALQAKYSLSADQAKQMYTIQVRKLRNLQSISGLKTSNLALYKSKLENLQTNTLASIRRLLNTKAQVELYQKTQSDVRKQRALQREEMLRQNAPRDTIEIALLEIYAE